MLVLSRKVGEKIVINENITVVVQRIAGNRVAIGIDAPQEVAVMRGELAQKDQRAEESRRAVDRSGGPVAGRIGFDSSKSRLVCVLPRTEVSGLAEAGARNPGESESGVLDARSSSGGSPVAENRVLERARRNPSAVTARRAAPLSGMLRRIAR